MGFLMAWEIPIWQQKNPTQNAWWLRQRTFPKAIKCMAAQARTMVGKTLNIPGKCLPSRTHILGFRVFKDHNCPSLNRLCSLVRCFQKENKNSLGLKDPSNIDLDDFAASLASSALDTLKSIGFKFHVQHWGSRARCATTVTFPGTTESVTHGTMKLLIARTGWNHCINSLLRSFAACNGGSSVWTFDRNQYRSKSFPFCDGNRSVFALYMVTQRSPTSVLAHSIGQERTL